jgi:hypothetical protein
MVVKRALSCMFALTLASGMLWAQNGPKVAHTTHHGSITPGKAVPATAVIYTNMGPTLTNLYNDTTGYYVLGSANSLGDGEQWIALPFIPRVNGHVSSLSAPIGSISGTNAVILGLYSDSSGTVGTLLAQGETKNIPVFGECCGLATVSITSTAVTAGTQYWFVAQADDTNAPDFTGVFESANADTVAYNPAQEGWFTFSANVPAILVRGTTP